MTTTDWAASPRRSTKEMKNTKKHRKLMVGILALLACLVFIPIWPISNPDHIISESEFNELKDEFELIAHNLNQEYRYHLWKAYTKDRESYESGEREKINETYKYQLAVKYGDYRGRKALLFGPKIQKTHTLTYSFFSHLREEIPHLHYDDESRYAYINPSEANELMDFSKDIEQEYTFETPAPD